MPAEGGEYGWNELAVEGGAAGEVLVHLLGGALGEDGEGVGVGGGGVGGGEGARDGDVEGDRGGLLSVVAVRRRSILVPRVVEEPRLFLRSARKGPLGRSPAAMASATASWRSVRDDLQPQPVRPT